MPVDPILESPGSRQHAGEPIAAISGLGGGELLPSMVNELATAPSVIGGAVGSESRVENLSVPKEQTALPEASEGMVGPAIRPPSPQVVPSAVAEEDEGEEIEHEEPQPQAV